MTRCYGPVIALSWVILGALPLLEGLIETEVMPNAILPAALVDAVEFKGVGNPLVDRCQGEAAVRSTKDGHANQLSVAVRGLGAVIVHDRYLKKTRKA